jgi:hypothetical protein
MADFAGTDQSLMATKFRQAFRSRARRGRTEAESRQRIRLLLETPASRRVARTRAGEPSLGQTRTGAGGKAKHADDMQSGTQTVANHSDCRSTICQRTGPECSWICPAWPTLQPGRSANVKTSPRLTQPRQFGRALRGWTDVAARLSTRIERLFKNAGDCPLLSAVLKGARGERFPTGLE